MARFRGPSELCSFAADFVGERVHSLEQDVVRCVAALAPFPALLYCFATTNLLGALHAGNASRNADNAKLAADFMRTYMHYQSPGPELLLKVFRHKITHLAEPRAVVRHEGKLISWVIMHDSPSQHLAVQAVADGAGVQVTDSWFLPATHTFTVSIHTLVQDIVRGTTGPRVYLAALGQSTALQANFAAALEHIYDPEQ